MEASAEIASSSVNALLSDDEEDKPLLQEAAPAAVSSCVELEAEKPLRSPFEAIDTSRPQAPPFPPANLHHRMSSKMVRFSGNLESFSEEPAGLVNCQLPAPPPMTSLWPARLPCPTEHALGFTLTLSAAWSTFVLLPRALSW